MNRGLIKGDPADKKQGSPRFPTPNNGPKKGDNKHASIITSNIRVKTSSAKYPATRT